MPLIFEEMYVYFRTGSMRRAHSASRGLNRLHFFISETVIRPRTCVPVRITLKIFIMCMGQKFHSSAGNNE